MNRLLDFTEITSFETVPISVINNIVGGAGHARSIIGPRAQNNPLIGGFSAHNRRKHLDTILALAEREYGRVALVSDGIDIGGVATASMPEFLQDNDGNVLYRGIFADCFYVGPNRYERLVEGYKLAANMGKSMLGTTVTTERVSLRTGRNLKPQIDEIPADLPIYALEVSPDFEVVSRSKLTKFLSGDPDIEAIRAIRAEANEAIVQAGFDFVAEGDFTRDSFPKTHQHGRYALYQLSA